jgi:hypothetical protein
MMLGMYFTQSDLDAAHARTVGRRAAAASQNADQLTANLLTGNCGCSPSSGRPNPNAVLGTPASLAFNYDAESHALGHRFDRPLRNKKRKAYDDDDDDDDDDEYETNRGEGLHSFDSTVQGSSGPHPDPRYGPMPPVRSVTTEKTSKRVVEWHPDQDHAAALIGKQTTPDGRIIEPLKPMKIQDLPAEDDHSAGHLFDLPPKKPAHVVIANQHREYVQNRAARVEETGALGPPGLMREIIETRLRECPKLRY